MVFMAHQEKLMSKRQLARLFQVSETSVGNWIGRGCPYREKPGSKVGSPYAFDLEEVKAWRLEQERDGRPQGGLKLERLPCGSEDRPDHENGMRYLTEAAVRSYLWHWMVAEDGANLVQGMLLDANGGDQAKANQALTIVVLSVVYAFTGWLAGDDFNRELIAGGSGIDEVWFDCTGKRVRTTAPTNRDAIRLEFPDWLLVATGQRKATGDQ